MLQNLNISDQTYFIQKSNLTKNRHKSNQKQRRYNEKISEVKRWSLFPSDRAQLAVSLLLLLLLMLNYS